MKAATNDQNDVKEEDTTSYEDIAVCVCGKRYVVLKASECYSGSGVACDECGKSVPSMDKVYHCPADKNNILHTQGYDICLKCYKKVSDEVNTDNALFQIWFVINGINKELYHVLAQKFEINSQRSLMSKSTNEMFEFVASIDWNKFIDGTSRKLFCDQYDALRTKLLSLKQSAYKFAPEQQQRSYGSSHGSQYKTAVSRPQQQYKQFSYGAPMMQNQFRGGAPMSKCSSFGGSAPRTTRSLSAHHTMSAPRNALSSMMSNHSANQMQSMSQLCCSSMAMDKERNIGFSVGGVGDINTFRLNVENHQVPDLSSISFEGIINEYYFDTSPSPIQKDDSKEGTEGNQSEEDLPCFYPSYSSSKSSVPTAIRKQQQPNTLNIMDMIAFDEDDDNKEFEHCLTVGLNSNIKEKDFMRKKLNLVVVLDISGSMSADFADNWSAKHEDSKMNVANKCLLLLLTHLNSDDRFGLVLFNNSAETKIEMKKMKKLQMKEIEDILKITASGGTNFEAGYRGGVSMYDNIPSSEGNLPYQQYENRLIFLTDAHPNVGATGSHDLLSMIDNAAVHKSIYTTFIGIGVDFNSDLISRIVGVRGANQFSIHSNKEFKKKLYAEFDYFVSPMVFDLVLTLFVEGSDEGVIDQVYGSDNIDVDNGEIMKINTLFPSPPNDAGDIKGGIVLIKLKKKCIQNKLPYFVQVTFEDKFGEKFCNKQRVVIPEYQNEYYPNLGVRKGLLLVHYVLFVKNWIESNNKTSNDTRELCKMFVQHFQNEMKHLKDDTLKKEIEIIQKLIAW